MIENNKAIIKRIENLLALAADNANKNESQLAYDMANKLLAKHRIKPSMVKGMFEKAEKNHVNTASINIEQILNGSSVSMQELAKVTAENLYEELLNEYIVNLQAAYNLNGHLTREEISNVIRAVNKIQQALSSY